MALFRQPLMSAPPAPPAQSLLTSALRPNDVDPDGNPFGRRWEEGFRWLPRACPHIKGGNECGADATVTYRTAGGSTVREHQPVWLTTANQCKSAMMNDFAFQKQVAIDALIASEPNAAEQELWEGTLARAAHTAGDLSYDNNLWLTKYQVATDLTGGTAVSVSRGIALLEAFLAATGTGGPGMLHVPVQAVPGTPTLRNEGPRLMTVRNTVVVPGVGYTGKGPATAANGAPTTPAAGTTWIYCTGMVTYRQGDIMVTPDEVGQALNRATNTIDIVAQRPSAATWDLCAVGAVLVTLPA